MQIYKYVIKKDLIGVPQPIDIPIQRRFYHIDYFNDQICLWYGVQDTPDVIHEPLTFVVLYTGDEVPNDLLFSRTLIDHKKGLVYHVFIKYQP